MFDTLTSGELIMRWLKPVHVIVDFPEMNLPSFLHCVEEGTLLDIHVQPRASRNEISGVRGACLKVRLTAPPVEGEANRACIRLLAKLLGISRSDVEIVQGHASRQKRLLIRGLSPRDVEMLLREKGSHQEKTR